MAEDDYYSQFQKPKKPGQSSGFVRFIKTSGKWISILLGIYIVASFLGALDFEARVGWYIFGLGLAIAYVDGSLKDRISWLEYQVREHEKRINGYD